MSNKIITALKIIVILYSLTTFSCTKEEKRSLGSLSNVTDSSSSNSSTNDTPVSRISNLCETKSPDNDTMLEISSLFSDFSSSNRNAIHLRSKSKILIPIMFHVISKGNSFEDGEIPDTFLIEQIDILNRAYAGESGGIPTPFEFEILGINRVRNSEWHTLSPSSPEEIQVKTDLKVGDSDTLNVYIADIVLEDQEGTVLGYSTLPVLYNLFPEIDGIVLNFRAVPGGPLKNYQMGNTLVHEVGHWLGLFHTFLGGCDGAFNDLVMDTPRHELPTIACPERRYDSCPNIPGKDPSNNHMNYTIDSCRYEFTKGQVNFMLFNAIIFRKINFFSA